MLFALELDRCSRTRGWEITSNVSHPGITATNLLAAQAEMGRHNDKLAVRTIRRASKRGRFAQTVPEGILHALYAATSPEAGAVSSTGPLVLRTWPAPRPSRLSSSGARSLEDAAKIWVVFERLTRVPSLECEVHAPAVATRPRGVRPSVGAWGVIPLTAPCGRTSRWRRLTTAARRRLVCPRIATPSSVAVHFSRWALQDSNL